jgi:hypothetical protein
MKLYALSVYDPVYFSFLGFQPLTIKLPTNVLYAYAAKYLKNYEQQRAVARGGILSDMAFSLTWAWEQFLYDWVQAPAGKPKPSVDHGPVMSSLRTFLQELLNSDQFYQVSLAPNSCSYERWVTGGRCEGDYTGFAKMFEVDATVRISAKSCGADTIPSVQALCVGAACDGVFGSPIACNSNLDCKGGLICAPLTDKTFLASNFDALFSAAIIEGSSRHFANDTRYAKCTGYKYYQKDCAHFLSQIGLRGNGVGICQLNWTKVTYTDTDYYYPRQRPTQHLMDWVRQAMEPLRRGSRNINLNWFRDWFSS